MRPFVLHSRVAGRIAEIEGEGGDCSDFFWILKQLKSGKDIPDRFNHHPLAGKLAGLFSVIVGHTAEGRTVVMVYEASRGRIVVPTVDEHDAAYSTLKIEQRAKRPRKRRRH
jgi:mRNA-degrading endonuclease YafQ of YafQ-DinJ toxin-antitoxin module